jgi:hypothetical protein
VLGAESDVAALPDGGFVSVWSEQSTTAYLPRLRVFNADGQPRTGAVVAGSTFWMKQVAADPSGGFGVIGASLRTIWAARFAPDGSARSGPFIVAEVPAPWRPEPEIEFDSQGNLFAVWAMFHENRRAICSPSGRCSTRTAASAVLCALVASTPTTAPSVRR